MTDNEPTPIQSLYNKHKTLVKQITYDKTEIDTALSGKADTTDIPDVSDVIRTSNTNGLVKNDGSIDTNTYLTEHQSLTNYVEKSSTAGLLKNDGTVDTNTYLTQHQSLTDYIQKSSTSGLVKNDGTIDTNTYLTSHQDISGKLDISQTSYKGKNVVVDDTTGDITFENKPTIPSKTSDLTNDGDGTNAFVKNNDSRLTDARTPVAHNQASSTITNSTAFDNILAGESTTLTLDDQAKINSAINTIIGSMKSTITALEGLEFIVITTSKGSASASTMGKLYIENSDGKTDAYYTEATGSGSNISYSWEKLEDDILEDVSIDWSDIQNKPLVFTPASHVHGNITNTGAIGSASGKVIVTGTDGVLTASDWIAEIDAVVQELNTYGASLSA